MKLAAFHNPTLTHNPNRLGLELRLRGIAERRQDCHRGVENEKRDRLSPVSLYVYVALIQDR